MLALFDSSGSRKFKQWKQRAVQRDGGLLMEELYDVGLKPVRRRRFAKRITASVVGAGALAAALAFGSSHFAGASGSPAQDGAVNASQAKELQRWKDEYDQSEVAALLAQASRNGFGEVDDQLLVGTLEFRHACRAFLSAVDATSRSGVDTQAIDSLTNDVTSRLAARSPVGDGSAAMFASLASSLKAGKVSDVSRWLSVNCVLTIK
jgi:hypothetical protein